MDEQSEALLGKKPPREKGAAENPAGGKHGPEEKPALEREGPEEKKHGKKHPVEKEKPRKEKEGHSSEKDVSAIAEEIKQKLSKALGKKPNVCAAIRKDGSSWKATIEVVEEEHIPSRFDTIGVYEVEADEKLNLKGWIKKMQKARG